MGSRLEELVNGQPRSFLLDQASWLDLEGVKIPIGRIRTYVESARLADPKSVRQAMKSGSVPHLRLVPGNSDNAKQMLVS